MPYYNEALNTYLINGVEVRLTEMNAEAYQKNHPDDDVQAVPDLDTPLPDEAADDYLDCSCQPDPPGGTAPLCNYCVLYFEELLEDL
jgi:hypothetical protein